MYPQLQIWRPMVVMAALVAASLFATSAVNVESGDTLSTIAERHDVSVADLIKWNDIDDPDRIFVGDRLIVAAPESATPVAVPPASHMVTAGDTLSGIARRLGSSIGALVAANGLSNPDRIYIGQRIVAESNSPPPPATTTSTQSTHTVARGDTLSSIAVSYGTKVGFIARDNSIDDPNQIRVGTVLVINPHVAEIAKPKPTPTPAPAVPPSGSSNRRPTEVMLAPMFEHWAATYNVSQDLLQAIAWKESTWRPNTVGPAGHLGIMQLRPDTASFIQENLLGKTLDPLAADDGLQLGARYLRYLLDRTNSEAEAVAAWRQGLSSIQSGGITTAGAQYVASVAEIRDQWT